MLGACWVTCPDGHLTPILWRRSIGGKALPSIHDLKLVKVPLHSQFLSMWSNCSTAYVYQIHQRLVNQQLKPARENIWPKNVLYLFLQIFYPLILQIQSLLIPIIPKKRTFIRNCIFIRKWLKICNWRKIWSSPAEKAETIEPIQPI